ncbi:MAG TPA: tetratricopeptide repeat protein [Roseiflexaceae bacterium]|nr:tetratricopeptide repeat protein [Roseiflexaceae bacterium]
MNSDVPFGAWLKQQRRALDLSREQLAGQIGCSISLLEKLETGERRPSRQVVARIALCLSIPVEQRDAFLAAARAGRAPHDVGQVPTRTAPSAAVLPHTSHLPSPMTSFIGREWEIATVAARLRTPDVRLLTLTGAGGVGKTRLALQIGSALHDAFPNGVWFVNLAPISDPALVLPTIAQTLGVREQAGMSRVAILRAALHEQQLLLLLDNFEQVVVAAPELALLLAEVPGLKLLVTSREALRLSGEHVMVVAPLAVPDTAVALAAEQLTQYAAAQLFVTRAQAASDQFRLTDANAPAVAAICARLDGLPLAIELAAAWVPLFPPAALLERLERRLPFLIRGPRDLPARQQTIRNTIEWSYHLLHAGEQTLFARLGVFVGGCTLEAAEDVCNANGDLSMEIIDGVAALVGQSLLRQEEGVDSGPRFTMLETIREYALERLVESGEAEAVQRQHAQHFLALAEEGEPQLYFTMRARWLECLEREHDNLRAALRWFTDQQAVEAGLHLGGLLCPFWDTRGHLTEGRRWLAELLALAAAHPRTAARAKALLGAGNLAYAQGDYTSVEQFVTESLSIARQVGDWESVAWSQYRLGVIAVLRGQYAVANTYLDESHARFRTMVDQRGASWALAALGWLMHFQGDTAAARPLLEESVAIFRQVRDTYGTAEALHLLAQVVERQNDLTTARAYEEESLAIWRETGDPRNMAFTFVVLGRLAFSQGDNLAARGLWNEGLAIAAKVQDPWCIGCFLGSFVALAAAEHQPTRALRLRAAADAAFQMVGTPLPLATGELAERGRTQAMLVVDAATQAAAHAEGQAMTLEQAVAYALEEAPPEIGTVDSSV